MVVWLFSGDMLTQQADADDMAVDFAPELQLDVTVAVRGERSEALKASDLEVLGQTEANRRVAVIRVPDANRSKNSGGPGSNRGESASRGQIRAHRTGNRSIS